MICESGLKQSTWQAQVEKAVENETEDFWTKVKEKTTKMCLMKFSTGSTQNSTNADWTN